MRFLAPPQATLLFFVLGLLGVVGGSAMGSWIGLAAVMIIGNRGWASLGTISRMDRLSHCS